MTPSDDPLHGNAMSGLLGLAAGPTLPNSEVEIPDHWEPPTPAHIAVLLPQYQIEHLIGRGGMGAVYKGRQITLQRPVAIKVLPAELARNVEFVGRFHREAQLLASLSHQGIVTIFDFGQTSEGHLYFVMEYVDGTDLYRLIHRSTQKLDAKTALSLTMQICEALQYAHDNGVVHRDIKPANVLVTRDGRAKLADFGLAMRPADPSDMPEPPKPEAYFDKASPNVADLRFTQPGAAMGTPDYAAPEVYEGKADERTDIYALGIMLYEMLTGAPPKGYFQLPSTMGAVDHRVDKVVVKALEIDPAARYQKAGEMKADVQAATQPLAKKAPPPPPKRTQAVQQPAPPPPARSRVLPPAASQPPSQKPRSSFEMLMWGVLILVLSSLGVAGWHFFQTEQGKELKQRLTNGVGTNPTPAASLLTPEERKQSLALAAKALESAQSITDETRKAKVLALLAPVQVKLGDQPRALALTDSISSLTARYAALAGVSAAQAETGDITQALLTANSIPDVTAKENAFAAICFALAERGDIAHADEIAALVADSSDSKVDILSAIAEACATAKDLVGYRSRLERAKSVAAACVDHDHRAKLNKFIVIRLAKAHDLIAAQEVLKRIPNDESHETKAQRQGALMNLAVAQAEIGDLVGASATIKSIEWFWAHDGALLAVCERMATNGDLTGAREQAEKMIHGYNRSPSRIVVAAAAGELETVKVIYQGWTHDSYRKPSLHRVTALLAEKKGSPATEAWIASLSGSEDRAHCYLKLIDVLCEKSQAFTSDNTDHRSPIPSSTSALAASGPTVPRTPPNFEKSPTLYQAVSIAGIANHPLDHIKPPIGRQSYHGIPFDFDWPPRNFATQGKYHRGCPTSAKLTVNIDHPRFVAVLLNGSAAWSKETKGKIVGSIILGFEDGSTFSIPLKAEVTMRGETWYHDSDNAEQPKGEGEFKFSNVITQVQNRSGPAKSFLDMLSVELPVSKAQTKLKSIEIIDTSIETVGSSGPAIDLAAITVGFVATSPAASRSSF